jgi:hypothetical protein
MINGDISNETSPRLLVNIEVVANSEIIKKTRVLLPSTEERRITGLNNVALSQLWNTSNKYGLSVELIAYEEDGWTQTLLDSFMNRLDRRGANPFNYAELYPNVHDVVSDMPYRPNLHGVVDLPERIMMYGSKGIDLYYF